MVFLCIENSARSQIAEGWLRQLSQGRIPVRSAGTQPSALHQLAIQVMAEVGVDIGYQQAKGLDALSRGHPDIVVTVCDRAGEACASCIEAPIRLHWSVPDPARAKKHAGDPIVVFRSIRDQLRARVEGLLATLPSLTNSASQLNNRLARQPCPQLGLDRIAHLAKRHQPLRIAALRRRRV